MTSVCVVGAPVGFVSDATDCNDGNAAVNPGTPEFVMVLMIIAMEVSTKV
ncbi:MAG: putative metal-binding motif-containing protein [Bacteroidetes bacterium]|nr:putative metal-binding motif-containing protein [Bacteroidota bacterium]